MTRTHGFLIALALTVAVVAGMFAALRTTQLGSASTPRVSSAQVQHQTRVLNRAEAALRAQLRHKPPRVTALGAASAPAAAPPQTVIYRRPRPIVHVLHRHGGDDSSERADGAGGGLDD